MTANKKRGAVFFDIAPQSIIYMFLKLQVVLFYKAYTSE